VPYGAGCYVATEIICRVVPGGLRAANEVEAEKLETLRGRDVLVKISQPRNLGFHKLFFAMLKISLDMADIEINAEQWRAIVTVGAGWCTFVPGRQGLIAVPKSISFGAMDETEFHRLYEAAIGFICANYVFAATPRDLDAQARFLAFL